MAPCQPHTTGPCPAWCDSGVGVGPKENCGLGLPPSRKPDGLEGQAAVLSLLPVVPLLLRPFFLFELLRVEENALWASPAPRGHHL